MEVRVLMVFLGLMEIWGRTGTIAEMGITREEQVVALGVEELQQEEMAEMVAQREEQQTFGLHGT